jgi:hypothetical protein
VLYVYDEFRRMLAPLHMLQYKKMRVGHVAFGVGR